MFLTSWINRVDLNDMPQIQNLGSNHDHLDCLEGFNLYQEISFANGLQVSWCMRQTTTKKRPLNE